jgi:hypothetical protein
MIRQFTWNPCSNFKSMYGNYYSVFDDLGCRLSMAHQWSRQPIYKVIFVSPSRTTYHI